MDTTKKLALREQFEAAYVAAYPTSSTLDSALFHREGDGQYERVQVQTAWTLYCAALSTPAATIQPSLKVAAADAPTMLNGLTADETSSTASVDGLASAPEPTDQQWQSIVNDAWMALPESVREAASADAGADHPLAVGVRMALAAPEPVALTDAREREAFEREMRCEEEWGHVSLTRYKSGGYKNTRTASMWSAWKSRAALQAPPSAPQPTEAEKGESK